MVAAGWLKEQRRVYFGNASSVRDYRAQLRGYKPAMFWALYLGLLILFAMIGYSSIVSTGEQSITQVQSQLNGFYHLVFAILQSMVALVAPVIVAMSIQGEAQRQSLDLVMTAPVSPKYFLVGKVLSGYRYIIMLLVLSLPIASAAVVLGGATWSEVLISYFMIAMHALLYIGISLPIAVLCKKVVSTVLYSYIACWTLALGAISSGIATIFAYGGPTMGSAEAPFILMVFPGSQTFMATTYTVVFGAHVPNWILASLTILLIVKFLMLCAGSAMTRAGSSETKSVRIHGLLLAALLSFAFTSGTASTRAMAMSAVAVAGGGPGPGSFAPPDLSREAATVVAWTSLFLVFALPYISCWSYLDERKHRPGGVFRMRSMLTASPEGGLPYIWAVLLCVSAGVVGAYAYFVGSVGTAVLLYLFWLVGAWTFFFAMGWLFSSFSRSGVGTARKSHVAFSIIVALLPWPVLGMLNLMLVPKVDLFQVYPLMGLNEGMPQLNVLVMAIEFWVLAALVLYWGEKRRKRSYPVDGGTIEQRT